jgi:hypothetical protein
VALLLLPALAVELELHGALCFGFSRWTPRSASLIFFVFGSTSQTRTASWESAPVAATIAEISVRPMLTNVLSTSISTNAAALRLLRLDLVTRTGADRVEPLPQLRSPALRGHGLRLHALMSTPPGVIVSQESAL